MDVKVSYSYGAVSVCIVRLIGEIDAANADSIKNRVQEEFDQGAGDLLLDLSGVPFTSSAGVRLIYWMNNQLHPKKSGLEEKERSKAIRDGTYRAPHFKILNPTKQVTNVLHMVGVDLYVDVFTDEDEAVGSFSSE